MGSYRPSNSDANVPVLEPSTNSTAGGKRLRKDATSFAGRKDVDTSFDVSVMGAGSCTGDSEDTSRDLVSSELLFRLKSVCMAGACVLGEKVGLAGAAEYKLLCMVGIGGGEFATRVDILISSIGCL